MTKDEIKKKLSHLPTLGTVPGTLVTMKQLDTAFWLEIADMKKASVVKYNGYDAIYIKFDNWGDYLLFKIADKPWQEF